MRVRTITAASAAMQRGQVSSEALVSEAVAAAERYSHLNAIAELQAERALATARLRDRELAEGRHRGPLHGIPLTVKDLFSVPGFHTRAGTRSSLPRLGLSTAVRRLEDAGAIIIAKANMHEVALGLTGENEWTGDVRNPHDSDRQSGGSSSGSAVAVAVGIGLGSLGTDTGGSIRVPAANCGVTGFKPAHGLVPLDGALPLSPTCDHAGPIARNIADARLLTELLSARQLAAEELVRPRLGIPSAYLDGRLSRSLRTAFESMLEELKDRGAEVRQVEVRDLELTSAAYTPLVRAEAAHVHRAALRDAPETFSPAVRRALELGASMPARGYLEARAMRDRVIAGLADVFRRSNVDALVLPTTPAPPLRRGETEVKAESGYLPYRDAQLALTAPFSLAGVPVAAIPFGSIEGLPVGMQIVTSWGQDALALNVAEWAERILQGRC